MKLTRLPLERATTFGVVATQSKLTFSFSLLLMVQEQISNKACAPLQCSANARYVYRSVLLAAENHNLVRMRANLHNGSTSVTFVEE